MKISYSLIIVNFHSIKEIADCLRSLINVHPELDYEVIIVSNSTVTDTEKEFINSISKECQWLQMEENVGYGRACNAGAAQGKGNYIFFLNPDTIFLNDAISHLKETVDAQEKDAVVGPATYNVQQEKIPSIKRKLTLSWMNHWLCPFVRMISGKSTVFDEKNYEDATDVDILSGSAIFMHRSAFRVTGGFSDDFFMYWEENDFCMRLRKKGYRILYEPKAKIIHHIGHSTRKTFLSMEIEKHRSQKTFMKKHHPKLARINRMYGIMAYSWRFLGSLLLFRGERMKQFGTLFIWYLTRYK